MHSIHREEKHTKSLNLHNLNKTIHLFIKGVVKT